MPHASAQQDIYKVQAVFLFKFFDYATWPAGKNPKEAERGVMCVYGAHPFEDTLDYIAERQSGSVRYTVRSVGNLADSAGCHILFVNENAYGSMRSAGIPKGALLVGNHAGFLKSGGMIEMLEKNGRVVLAVNLKNAENAGLKLSSRLLEIAEVR